MPQLPNFTPARDRPAGPAFASLRWASTLCALIFAVAFVAYFPALQGDFLWDDDGHVTRPDLRSLDGLLRIWFEPGATQQYYPLLHSAFWLEYHVWGERAVGYHLLNVLLHATAACLLARALQRLRVPGAWFAAGLFAVHPVMVESVAWISEQKNTLSAVFLLCALLAWLRFDENRTPIRYVAASAWFVAALLTKSVTATLPAALLVITWWRWGRLAWRDFGPLLPWFVAAVVLGLYTAHFERTQIGAGGAEFASGVVERGLIAGRAFWFYLGKLAWPGELLFFYPRWNIDPSEGWQYAFPTGAVVLAVGVFWWRRRSRGPLAVLLLFVGTLFPALGFLNVYPFVFSFVADHFQYHGSLAVFAAVGAIAAHGGRQIPRPAMIASAGIILLALGARASIHCRDFHGNEVLFRATLAGNPDCWVAHHNLAFELAKSGRFEEATSHLRRVIALRSASAPAENNLGDNLTQLGRPAEALAHLQRALTLQPDYLEARYNLGAALMALDQPGDARIAFEAAVTLAPDYAPAHSGLGRALASTGRLPEAILHLERAVALDPDDAEARIDLGFALMLAGRPAAAVLHVQAAVNLRPDFPEAHNVLGRALAGVGRFDESVFHFSEALRLNPDFVEARRNLAQAQRQASGAP